MTKNRIQFRKLYKKLGERDYGQEIDSIISYQKVPFMHEVRRLSEDESILKGCEIEQTVTVYKYRLFIDLWLFTLMFIWTDKIHATDSQ